MTDKISLDYILADLLDLDLAIVKQKISGNKLRDEFIKYLQQDKTIYIQGIGKFYPDLLQPGEFYDTRLRRFKPVPARLSPRFKLIEQFKKELKKLRTNNIDYY